MHSVACLRPKIIRSRKIKDISNISNNINHVIHSNVKNNVE